MHQCKFILVSYFMSTSIFLLGWQSTCISFCKCVYLLHFLLVSHRFTVNVRKVMWRPTGESEFPTPLLQLPVIAAASTPPWKQSNGPEFKWKKLVNEIYIKRDFLHICYVFYATVIYSRYFDPCFFSVFFLSYIT